MQLSTRKRDIMAFSGFAYEDETVGNLSPWFLCRCQGDTLIPHTIFRQAFGRIVALMSPA